MRVDVIKHKLEVAMVGLSKTDRELLLQRASLTGNQSMRVELFLDGKSLNEIAAIDGISRESVNSSLSAAQSKLTTARRSLG